MVFSYCYPIKIINFPVRRISFLNAFCVKHIIPHGNNYRRVSYIILGRFFREQKKQALIITPIGHI